MTARAIFALVFIAMSSLACSQLRADESIPLLYTRTHANIIRQSPPPAEALPWQEQKPSDSKLMLDIEVRDGASLYNQKDWFNISGLSEKSGVLLVFGAPMLAPVVKSAQYAPLDILMLDKEGTIKQILPSLNLSEVTEEIYPAEPITAFLFLRGGTCKQQSIQPGDIVEYKIFKRPPVILNNAPRE